MPELNEQQKKRYEEVREWLSDCFAIARKEGAIRKWEDGQSDANEVLADPRIAILDEDQALPSIDEWKYDDEEICKGYSMGKLSMLQSNFRRVLPKKVKGDETNDRTNDTI